MMYSFSLIVYFMIKINGRTGKWMLRGAVYPYYWTNLRPVILHIDLNQLSSII